MHEIHQPGRSEAAGVDGLGNLARHRQHRIHQGKGGVDVAGVGEPRGGKKAGQCEVDTEGRETGNIDAHKWILCISGPIKRRKLTLDVTDAAFNSSIICKQLFSVRARGVAGL